MAFQPSVVEYFSSRKRPASDDLKKAANPNKVVILEELSNEEAVKSQNTDTKTSFVKKIVYSNKQVNIFPNKAKHALNRSVKPSASSVSKVKKVSKVDGCQMDIRKTLFKASGTKKNEDGSQSFAVEDSTIDVEKTEDGSKSLAVGDSTIELSKNKQSTNEIPDEPNVPFHVKGPLSPRKPRMHLEAISNIEPSKDKNEPQSSLTVERTTLSSRKELNLGNIKAMMSRSSRLEEMKAALKRFNENKANLDNAQAESAKRTPEGLGNISVLSSPAKTPKKAGHFPSPQGKLTPSRLFDTPPPVVPPSPLKSPLRSPAFQRYQALVSEGRPALVLPFKYRALAEVFRCVDTVASMLYTRKETITLSKLRPGVQEISRKNLTEYHLGQIKTLFPDAFEFTIEKMRSFGATEKFELVITPLIPDAKKEEGEGDGRPTMGPSVQLARRRTLYNALLELTKDHHEVFLKTLDPPMNIPRQRLTRWHPEFAVDDVPDIISAALPQPPNVERVTTAKDILERARNLFVVNPRMARALQKVSQNCSSPTLSNPTLSDSTPTPPSNKPALHGVPASILERVRAKQAARTLEAMTRTPAQAKEAVRLTRLPEIARIVRNLFVAEKKRVLPQELVLRKMADSYRENLSIGELHDHLKLLAEKTDDWGWITFCNLRKTDYVKLSSTTDMSCIMGRLEKLAEEKCM